MIYKNLLFLVTCGTLLALSCDYEQNADTAYLDYSNTPARVTLFQESQYITNDTFRLRERIENIKLVSLDSEDSLNVIGGISNIYFTDTSIIVVDKRFSAIKVFSQDGNFLYNIGNRENDTDQFNEITSTFFDSSRKHIIIFSNSTEKFYVYSLDGNLVKSKKVDFYGNSITALNDSIFVFYTGYNFSESTGYNNIVFLDTGFNIKARFSKAKHRPKGLFGWSGFVNKTSEGVLFAEPLSDTVFLIKANGVCIPAYYFDFGSYKVPEVIKEDFVKTQSEILKYSTLHNDIIDIDSFLIFRYQHLGKFVFGSYDKRTRKLVSGKNYVFDNIARMFHFPITKRGRQFVTYFEPASVLKNLRASPNFASDIQKFNPELYRIVLSLKETDNPVLIFYSIKW